MNFTSLIITLQIAMVCIGGGVTRPATKSKNSPGSSASQTASTSPNSAGIARRQKSGRRLRMLHKMLNRLTPEDMLELSRSKKDRSYLGNSSPDNGPNNSPSNSFFSNGNFNNPSINHYIPVNNNNPSNSNYNNNNPSNNNFKSSSNSNYNNNNPSNSYRNLSHNKYTNHPPANRKPPQEDPNSSLEIDCPRARDGVQLFSCPTPDRYGIYRCIDDHALCDNKPDCPNREDENKTVCMFHKMTMNYFKVLMDAVFGLTRSMV